MALAKAKKEEIIGEVKEALTSSKLTVITKYRGTPVKSLQNLRSAAKEKGTVVKVIKNRLVIKAIESNDKFKDVDRSIFNEMLLYAFNSEDELASAQTIAEFIKLNPNAQIVGALSSAGEFISSDDTKALASIPSKDALRAQLLSVISAPLSGFANVMSGNLRGVLYVLSARSQNVSSN